VPVINFSDACPVTSTLIALTNIRHKSSAAADLVIAVNTR
jgi:hypothetical protein